MLDFRGKSYQCHMEVTLDLIGGKWKAVFLWHMGKNGAMRHGELKRLHPRLTPKMLTQQLRELESDDLVTRTVYNQVPPRVEYSLTERGRGLMPLLDTMIAWGKAYMQTDAVRAPGKLPAAPRPEDVNSRGSSGSP